MAKKKPKPDEPAKKQPLPRDREPKPLSIPRQMQRDQLLGQLHDLVVACEELFEAHGASCDCETCSVASNFVGALRLFRLVLQIS
jgi:hypothetical protein